jgi:hypothetical protein
MACININRFFQIGKKIESFSFAFMCLILININKFLYVISIYSSHIQLQTRLDTINLVKSLKKQLGKRELIKIVVILIIEIA